MTSDFYHPQCPTELLKNETFETYKMRQQQQQQQQTAPLQGGEHEYTAMGRQRSTSVR